VRGEVMRAGLDPGGVEVVHAGEGVVDLEEEGGHGVELGGLLGGEGGGEGVYGGRRAAGGFRLGIDGGRGLRVLTDLLYGNHMDGNE
jgi:hypothetical protein